MDVRGDMLKALQNISAPGSFASFHGLKQPPPAHIWVDGIGHVSLPLGGPQAEQLIARCRQAPFGKGSDTIVDTSVRNTWELDSTQFSIEGDGWAPFLEGLRKHVAKDLGIDMPIKAEIYKMLVYEKGAMFKPHAE